ncbi:preprotein translocase subunit SecY [Natranaerobius thermophilus]|uniref:Protein translocase subunit SecY n=1 Tax=Natranaerobius thermophilus (strain ATCC BAA-1301 / DSM 18059 / JW/NM-WN-LF) TaxID=457570 RepID=B2A4F9_NATTJ|nr:preprotein translocase subunit SecY [Natranaerobius thermophilus]ACB83813.1 protein translocase subunit secY/sec61 alpha [Natranaerobius thermophilus JW/NM-WN-LF]
MLGTLVNAWRIKDLRQKLIFTLAMLFVFRLGAHVPVPGIDATQIQQLFEGQDLFGFLNVIAGGALSQLSIFAMSITPYINASIIMQLLTVVVPKFEQWSKEGQEGKKKLAQYTRYGTVIIAFLQAIGMTLGLLRPAVVDPSFTSYMVIILSLTAGTAFLMWLGEQINDRGIGNGISIIIFAGIVSRIPQVITTMYEMVRVGEINILLVLVLLAILLSVIVGVVALQEGRRQIPVQYAKRVVGRKMYGGQSTHIPLKVNQAGVIPVIFASSILMFPETIAQFIQHPIAVSIANAIGFGTPLNTVLYVVLIVFFTYFYTAIQFNPQDMADNMKKYGGFIPGIRPGKPTAKYLSKIMDRITLAGAFALAGIVILPILLDGVVEMNIMFGGTALIIMVGVALETMKQIESQMLMRHYQGFMKK